LSSVLKKKQQQRNNEATLLTKGRHVFKFNKKKRLLAVDGMH